MVVLRSFTVNKSGQEVSDMEWEPMTIDELKAIYNLITTKDE